ncbi:MAG: gamma-glutamyltransferase [Alphaproteobacteria bacterium]|nr:gamma-glutamyltransferase [Alphaproteobacteria bacterium]
MALFGLVLAAAPALAREPAPLARTHMVAAAHPLAAEAGLAMLRAGGTAVDAAVAVQMVLGVVEPQASGIGGGGFLMHYDARSRQVTAWDGRETAPAGARESMFLAADGKPVAFPLAVVSGLSVGVPGAVRMLHEAHRRHGKLPWRDLFAPAIKLADEGYAVPPRLARALSMELALQTDPQARAVYFNDDGSPRRQGDVIRNPALAATLRRLADGGADALYRGTLADDIVAAVRQAPRPGTMSADDLAAYRALQRAPLCRPYRSWTICGMGPPSSGPSTVLQALALLALLPAGDSGATAQAHRLAEASRLAFADRDRWLADPGFQPVPVDGLLDPDYLATRAGLVNGGRSIGKAAPGLPPGAVRSEAPLAPNKQEGGTSHMAIVDRDGNVVSFTTTIEAVFGARRMVGGFLLNNELTDFSLAPVDDGRPVANRVQPGKRPRSSMTPLIVLDRDGRFVLAIGSAGGSRIIGDVLQTLQLALDDGKSLQDAIAAPRILNRNGATEIERSADAEVLANDLRALGHDVVIRRHDGGLHGVRVRYDGEGKFLGYEGGADPRRDGAALGE